MTLDIVLTMPDAQLIRSIMIISVPILMLCMGYIMFPVKPYVGSVFMFIGILFLGGFILNAAIASLPPLPAQWNAALYDILHPVNLTVVWPK
jgi:hypothetical protein